MARDAEGPVNTGIEEEGCQGWPSQFCTGQTSERVEDLKASRSKEIRVREIASLTEEDGSRQDEWGAQVERVRTSQESAGCTEDQAGSRRA